MKKSVVTHILVMIMAVAIGAFLATTLVNRQEAIKKSNGDMSKAPLGGFNKFASDIQWMLFVNYAGGLSSVEKENVGEIYKRLNSILANDPDLEIAYDVGGMMLSVRDPQKSAEIFMRGAKNPKLKDSWKLPFLAGHVLDHYVTDNDDPERLKKAEEMFRMAAARSQAPPHVTSALIRTRAKRIAKRGKWSGIKIANFKHAYLCALFDEWRKGGNDQDMVFSENTIGISDIKPRLLKAAQDAKAEAPKDKNVLKTVDRVMKKVLEDQHLCGKCLSPYAAGDKFCSKCGNGVKPYGVCPKCQTVLKGKFCCKCGYASKGK
jgi:hypothetical protein